MASWSTTRRSNRRPIEWPADAVVHQAMYWKSGPVGPPAGDDTMANSTAARDVALPTDPVSEPARLMLAPLKAKRGAGPPLSEIVRISVESLLANRMRSLLTMLG